MKSLSPMRHPNEVKRFKPVNRPIKSTREEVRVLRPASFLVLAVIGAFLTWFFMPSGLFSHIDQDYKEALAYQENSPLKKICSNCGKSATQSETYMDGNTYYFCPQHEPPKYVKGTPREEKGEVGMNPTFIKAVFIFLLIILGIMLFIRRQTPDQMALKKASLDCAVVSALVILFALRFV